MSDFLQPWLKNDVIKIVNEILSKDNSKIRIEEAVKNVQLEECRRVQIAQFLKCPTKENPNDTCLSYVIDKTNFIMAIFSTKALDTFRANEPDISFTSLRGCFIILKKYNFSYDNKSRQLQLYIDNFDYIGGQANVYPGELQSINEIPSIKTFLSVIYSRIKEEEKNEEVYHYGWKDINKISDEDCYISSEDRSILDNLPGIYILSINCIQYTIIYGIYIYLFEILGWSEPNSPFILNEEINNNDILNHNDPLFNSQSIFEIVDFKPEEDDENNRQNENRKKSEKRYRDVDVISDDSNQSENDMNIETQLKFKRMKNNDYEEDDQPLMFTQPMELIPDQDINMEINSNFSDHLSTSTDDNLTSNFAPAGAYINSNNNSEISENEYETDKESIFSNSYTSNKDKNSLSFNTQKIIEKVNFFSQANPSDDASDEILYESANLDRNGSINFINNNESWDNIDDFNLYSSQNSSNNSVDLNDTMMSENFQYMNEKKNSVNNIPLTQDITTNNNSHNNNNIPLNQNYSKNPKENISKQKMIDETEKMLNQLEINFRGLKNTESANKMIESLKIKLKALKSDTISNSNSKSNIEDDSLSKPFSDIPSLSSSSNEEVKNKKKEKSIEKENNEIEIRNKGKPLNSINEIKNIIIDNSKIEKSSEKEKNNNEMFNHIENMLEQLSSPDILKNIKKRDSIINKNNLKKNKDKSEESSEERFNDKIEDTKEIIDQSVLNNTNKTIACTDDKVKKFDLTENSKDTDKIGISSIKSIEKNNIEKKRKATKRKISDINKNSIISNEDKLNKRNQSKEENGFRLYQKRIQEKKKKIQENNTKINESFTRINEQEKNINKSPVQEKIINNSNSLAESINDNNKEQDFKAVVQPENQNIFPIKDKNDNLNTKKYEINNTNDFNEKNKLEHHNLSKDQNKNDIVNNIEIDKVNEKGNNQSLHKKVNVNSPNRTPIKPTSILKKSTSESYKKKSVSFNTNIDIKVIPSIPQTKKIPIRSPKRTDDVSSFFASLSPPSKQNKHTIFSKYSSSLLNQSGLSPLSSRNFIRQNKSSSPLSFIKSNLFIDNKSLKNHPKIINETKNYSSFNKNFESNNPERRYAEASKKLNQIFTLQHNNKLNESRANSIKENSLINISSSVSSPIKSQNNPTSNVNNVNTNKTTNGQPINNNNYNNDYSNNKQIQFKEIKSNTDVMEKIFLNDDHENIEVKEKHFNDFNILKKLISDKEKNKNENSIIKEEIKQTTENNKIGIIKNNSINEDKFELSSTKEENEKNDNNLLKDNTNNKTDKNEIINKNNKNDCNIVNTPTEDKCDNKLLVKNSTINHNSSENKKDELIINSSIINIDIIKNEKNDIIYNVNNSEINLDNKRKTEISTQNDSLINPHNVENIDKRNTLNKKNKSEINSNNSEIIIENATKNKYSQEKSHIDSTDKSYNIELNDNNNSSKKTKRPVITNNKELNKYSKSLEDNIVKNILINENENENENKIKNNIMDEFDFGNITENEKCISIHHENDTCVKSNELLPISIKKNHNNKYDEINVIKEKHLTLNEQYSSNNANNVNTLLDENINNCNDDDSMILDKFSYNNESKNEIQTKENNIYNEKEYKKGLHYIENHINKNNYYQSLKVFYDMFTPASNETQKIFEIGNTRSKEYDNTNMTNCTCRNCFICKNDSIKTVSNDKFKIDYTNWKFY
ncbi:hypothetical protein BCR36DRAFT_409041 [Piromyces finnis]|uniref:Uncharacterized protein n=1 Tax=Piromyces finnis TaxID=1754191 RepID=A0A1Y1VKC7_9FUNG|nr:hypothetical protein BCR36DRAFT_409041 [Piromyces finnis]|eukprot:ORX58530.1 hypothetical protein BCR36DRAFT_409041 [Piromyces finnis]